MPWKIEKRDGDKWCVVKKSDGSTVHCHDTEEKAKAQLRALYASEDTKMSYIFGVGTARRKGKIFEAGLFPERNLEITPEDVANCIKNTTFPIPIVHDHWDSEGKSSVFDKKLGQLTKAYADPTFNTIFGESEWPDWVEDALDGEEKKVSVWLDPETFAIKSVSLTASPRIKDAALSERLAFSYNKFHSEPEEEMTVEDVKKVVTDALTGWKPPKSEPEPKVEPKAAETKFSESPEFKAMEERNKALEATVIAQKNERIKDKALTFATRQHEDGKIVAKGERTVEQQIADLASEHERAQRDDERDAAAGQKFDDTYKARVALLETRFKEMTPIGRDGELITGQVLQFGNEKPEDVDAEVARVMGNGPFGRALLGKEKK